MKKSLVMFALLLAILAGLALAPAQPASAQSAAPKKEIKDSSEYNAYVNAIQQTDPNAKINALEGFLTQYPNTVVKEDALEALMGAYQQAGNAAKVQDTANRVLQVNPNNIRALALMSYLARATAEAGQNTQQNAAKGLQYGQQGLQALKTLAKPDGMSDADFDKLKTQTSVIFQGAVGFGALQAKDYKTAQQGFQAAVTADPGNLQNVYPLAVAYLEDKPMNPLGLWYAARAVTLSNNNADVAKYGRYKYIKYHGGDDGWNDLVAQAKANATQPANFAVAPAPSPADQAKMLADKKDPKQMDFGEWEMVLSEGAPDVQQKVWDAIKGMKVPFAAKVITATKTTLQVAATADAIQSNVADVEVTMTAPLTVALMPKVGAEIQIQAQPDSYTPKPFMMKMNEGQLIVQAKPGAKKPVRR